MKTEIKLAYDLASSFLGIYLEQTLIQKLFNSCTPTFIAALLTIAQTWEQPKSPCTGEWIKIVYINICTCMRPKALHSCPTLCNPLWTVAHKAPPSMEFSRQEYWSGVHSLFQGFFPTQGLDPCLLRLLL